MSTLARAEFDISMTLRSPFLMQGLKSPLLGADVTHIRDEAGNPIIPADQVRGVLRAATKVLVHDAPGVLSADAYTGVFGPEASSDEDSAGVKGVKADRLWALHFGDLTAQGIGPNVKGETTRIEIDDVTGAAKTGALLVVERVVPFGKSVEFVGTGTIFAPLCELDDGLVEALNKALQLIGAIGAFKTAGFGEVVAASITMRGKPTELTLPTIATGAGRIAARYHRVTFDMPILVDAEWVADNAFEGAEVIPGSVFKGALAQRLRRGGAKPENMAALTALRISHAFPEAAGGALGALPLPLSLVGVEVNGGVRFGDAIDVPDGEGALVGGKAPLFVPDWKDDHFKAAKALLKTPAYDPPARITRTHTKIGDLGVASDQMLFSTIARSNLGADGQKRGWIARVDPSAIEDAGEAAKFIALLEEGLDGIGKTNARATLTPIDREPANAAGVKHVHGRPGDFALVLRTPAVLLDPRSGKSVEEQYGAYFAQACPGFKLVSFYAQQRLAGRYAAMRHRPYGATYYPFVLTDPGSIFLLQSSCRNAAQTLTKLLEAGLPLPSLTGAELLDWKICPFTPDNGYGAFTADYLSNEHEAALIAKVTHG